MNYTDVNLCLNCSAELSFISINEYCSVASDVKIFSHCGEIAECSDCGLIQKKANDEWHTNARSIYSNYRMFHQSNNGQEQKVFTSDGPALSRSASIISSFKHKYPAVNIANILDIGCGNGPTLKVLSKEFPSALLYGYEIESTNEDELKRIRNFQNLYTGDISNIKQKFDLIILFHSLEHVPWPKEFLKEIQNLVSNNGKILIQVPNIDINFYDLIVADHRSHFSSSTLIDLCKNTFGNPIVSMLPILAKELTIVLEGINRDFENQKYISSKESSKILEKSLNRLAKIKTTATTFFMNEKCPLGIFGTSIAATWLFAEFKNKVSFFIDEDENRIGNFHENIPIYSMDNIPKHGKVFFPPMSSDDSPIIDRLMLAGVDFITEPNLFDDKF